MTAAATVPSSRTRAKTRVLIAAEQGATRAGVRLALAPIAICSEASDASSAIDIAVRERPDVCLLEMNMPGRGLTAADLPVVRSVVRNARSNNYRFSTLVLGIVNSAPFRMRTAGNENE